MQKMIEILNKEFHKMVDLGLDDLVNSLNCVKLDNVNFKNAYFKMSNIDQNFDATLRIIPFKIDDSKGYREIDLKTEYVSLQNNDKSFKISIPRSLNEAERQKICDNFNNKFLKNLNDYLSDFLNDFKTTFENKFKDKVRTNLTFCCDFNDENIPAITYDFNIFNKNEKNNYKLEIKANNIKSPEHFGTNFNIYSDNIENIKNVINDLGDFENYYGDACLFVNKQGSFNEISFSKSLKQSDIIELLEKSNQEELEKVKNFQFSI